MKKIIIILIFILSNILYSYAQTNMLQYNKCVDFNFGYNVCNGPMSLANSNVERVSGLKISGSAFGIYFDASLNVEGNHSGNTGIDNYYGYKTSSWHLGYSFPVCRWFKIIPIVGMSKYAEGYYDGSDWYITRNGISNKFKQDGFGYIAVDYGVVFNFNIYKFLNIYTSIERCNFSIGAGISIPFNIL